MKNKEILNVGIAGYGVVGKRRRHYIDQHPRLKTIEQGKFRGGWQAMIKAIEEDKNPRKLISLAKARKAG